MVRVTGFEPAVGLRLRRAALAARLKYKRPLVHRREHKKERQVLVIPVFLGPSDWIRTSGLLNPICS